LLGSNLPEGIRYFFGELALSINNGICGQPLSYG